MGSRSAPETKTIDIIAPSERRGRVGHLFVLWFGNNLTVLSLVTGALAVQFGLGLPWALLAILLGNVLGAVPVAFHSVQGPRLGVPQMIQTRAQFGYYGASFFLLLVFVICFGYFASTQALSGLTLVEVAPAISPSAAIVLLSVPVLVLALYGYDWIHRYQRAATVILGVCMLYVTIDYLVRERSEISWVTTAPPLGLFFSTLGLFVVYQLTWAPFVADYSRYLPVETPPGRAFSTTYFGLIGSAIWLQVLGAIVAAVAPDASSALGSLAGVSGQWVLVVMAVSLIGAAATTLYSGMLSLVTLVESLGASIGARLRAVGILATLAVGLTVALTGYETFVTDFTNFLSLLLFLMIPWTAVNLADYYIVRRGDYDVRALFDPRGIYGRWRWQGLVAYAAGLVIEVPFINQVQYVGPLAKSMNGADVSWLVGLILPAVLYVVLERATNRADVTAFVDESFESAL